MPSAMPLMPLGDSPGLNGRRLIPSAPPLPRTKKHRTRITATSIPNSRSAASIEIRMPRIESTNVVTQKIAAMMSQLTSNPKRARTSWIQLPMSASSAGSSSE